MSIPTFLTTVQWESQETRTQNLLDIQRVGKAVCSSKVSDYKYSYVMKRTTDTLSAKYSDIVSEFTKIYQSTIYEKSFENLIDIDEDGFHEVLKILSKKYNFKYKREKNDK